ncbi:MAG: TonB family protein [Gracilimonas sp.]|uniref:energy transducer TonB n=1 Tax=Gracilimonas TaxID=649462 RepID=UPI001B2730F8|nr:energy transducer TonB [Gracilimonas sp.]MBO6584514.1 TonB family protein [Gracilimonas sp.]MBO6616215.1 TonB family protein [Gracilimonas sp.]
MIKYQGSSPISRPSSTVESVTQDSSKETPHTVIVLSVPVLEGGNRALRNRIEYPDEAIENNIEGIVSILFTINEDGSTSNFEVLQEIGYGCEEMVIKAIQNSKFETGQLNHQVNARYRWMVSVEFKL